MTQDAFASGRDPLRALTANNPPQVVLDANAAFERIREHKLLFRRDWLPFIDGVNHVSTQALLLAQTRSNSGTTITVDGKPDWTNPLVQAAFRELTQDMPWRDYFTINHRRSLLQVIRQIGAERDEFLAWYDALPEKNREQWGHPRTLWRKYETRPKPEHAAEPEGKHEPEQDALIKVIQDLVSAEPEQPATMNQDEEVLPDRAMILCHALGLFITDKGLAKEFEPWLEKARADNRDLYTGRVMPDQWDYVLGEFNHFLPALKNMEDGREGDA
jgi:hypothetical protein